MAERPLIVDGLPIDKFWSRETAKEMAVPSQSKDEKLGDYNTHRVILHSGGGWADEIRVVPQEIK